MQGRDANFLIGVPKDFDQIVSITSQLDLIPVQNKDRVIAIKELTIYANSGPQALQQLLSLEPAKHAAISLESNDQRVIQASLYLANKVLSAAHTASAPRQFLDFGGGEHCLKLLASIEVSFRCEAIKLLSHLVAKLDLPAKFINEIFVRIAVLLDEALKDTENSPAIKEQSLMCLEVLMGWL